LRTVFTGDLDSEPCAQGDVEDDGQDPQKRKADGRSECWAQAALLPVELVMLELTFAAEDAAIAFTTSSKQITGASTQAC